MFKRLSLPLVALSLFASAAAEAKTIGYVLRSQPDSFQAEGAVGYVLRSDDDVYRDARIYTKSYGSVRIEFDDGTDLLISPNSSIVLDSYVYAGDGAPGSMALSLAKGALRVISGRMAKESYRVDTTIASIGVRGTRYWLDVDEPGILKIWTDEGTVVARPVATDEVFVFEAPVYAECTTTTCEITPAPPPPVKFPTDPRSR
ncbi:MAG: FecR domain-containing protein [Pseudomonadota bacterium]